MGVLAAGVFAERLPGLDRDLAVGLRRQHQDHLGGVDVGLDARQALGGPLLGHHAVERPGARPRARCSRPMPLPPLPSFSISGPSAVKRL
jgi:hypothetical protein